MTRTPQKNILMTKMSQIVKKYQNDENATTFSSPPFSALF